MIFFAGILTVISTVVLLAWVVTVPEASASTGITMYPPRADHHRAQPTLIIWDAPEPDLDRLLGVLSPAEHIIVVEAPRELPRNAG